MKKYYQASFLFAFALIFATSLPAAIASTGGCSNVSISHWGKVRKSNWQAQQMAKRGWHWKVRQLFGSATEEWKWAKNKGMGCKRRGYGWQCQARGKPCW